MKAKQTVNNDMKHITTLALLLGMAFMLPSFSEGIVGAQVSSNSAAVFDAVSSNRSGSVKFPPGYTCTPNPSPVSDVTAKVTGDPKLVLTYDSSNKEALLTAKFNVTVDGGKTGVYVYQYPYISFHDASGNFTYANTQRNLPLLPVSKMDKKTDSYGQVVYWVAPNKQGKFVALGSINPKSLLSGSYTASLDVLIGESSLTNPSGFKIIVNQNQTNSKTIIGETSPYISSVSSQQVSVGDKFAINGQRFNDQFGFGKVYIDDMLVSTNIVDGSKDGTVLFFNLPEVSAGWHIVTVVNSEGTSNPVGIEVMSQVTGSPAVSNTSVKYSTRVTSQSGTTSQQFTIGFAVTAANDPIYISTSVPAAIGSSFTPQGSMQISILGFNDDNSSGDAPSYFYVAPGQTKNFAASFNVVGMSTDGGGYQVNYINYGTSPSNTTSAAMKDATIQNLKAVLFH